MKYLPLSIRLLALAFILTLTVQANAGGVVGPAPISLTVNEAGNGRMDFASIPFISVPGSLAADPGPGGRASALTYSGWLFTSSFITGDVFLTGPGGTLDVIRFNWSSTTLEASLVFYSMPGAGLPADTGFPSSFYSNTFSLVENPNGTTTYTPTPGQPGYLTFPFSYIINTPAAVPEGGPTIILLVLASAALFGWQWRLTKSES